MMEYLDCCNKSSNGKTGHRAEEEKMSDCIFGTETERCRDRCRRERSDKMDFRGAVCEVMNWGPLPGTRFSSELS